MSAGQTSRLLDSSSHPQLIVVLLHFTYLGELQNQNIQVKGMFSLNLTQYKNLPSTKKMDPAEKQQKKNC